MFMPNAVGRIVDKLARQTVGKDWGAYAALLDRWAEIAGRDYADISTPVKLSFPYQPQQARRENGTLHIRLPKGLMMEFTYRSEQIRQRVNAYFGYNAIARLAFEPVFGALKPPKRARPAVDPARLASLTAPAQPIENDELRAALTSLGAAMLADSDREKMERTVQPMQRQQN